MQAKLEDSHVWARRGGAGGEDGVTGDHDSGQGPSDYCKTQGPVVLKRDGGDRLGGDRGAGTGRRFGQAGSFPNLVGRGEDDVTLVNLVTLV